MSHNLTQPEEIEQVIKEMQCNEMLLDTQAKSIATEAMRDNYAAAQRTENRKPTRNMSTSRQ